MWIFPHPKKKKKLMWILIRIPPHITCHSIQSKDTHKSQYKNCIIAQLLYHLLEIKISRMLVELYTI